MTEVMVHALRKGDTFRFTAESAVVYTVRGVHRDDNPELFTLQLNERGDITLLSNTPVVPETMFRLVKVPCLIHHEDLELLYNMASGGTPRGVVCGDCDEKITARVRAAMEHPEPARQDVVYLESTVETIAGFSADRGTRLSNGQWVCASELVPVGKGFWRHAPGEQDA